MCQAPYNLKPLHMQNPATKDWQQLFIYLVHSAQFPQWHGVAAFCVAHGGVDAPTTTIWKRLYSDKETNHLHVLENVEIYLIL